MFKEKEATAFASAMRDAESRVVSAATVVETAMVAEGRTGPAMGAELDELLGSMRAEIVPFTAEHAALARDAWRRYGKGRHPAGLNLGDCFSYALAKARNEPLLFKGDDFARTDVKAAI
nr:type II toxin-antitoxin system VapC family toxin [Neoroseomonas terrae]